LGNNEEEEGADAREEECGCGGKASKDWNKECCSKHGSDMLQAKSDGKWPAQALIWGYDFSRFDR
jgi:hypothetical protein